MNAMERREGHISSRRETEIYYQSWITPTNPAATFVLTHGHGEHSDCYHITASDLVKLGYSVYAWDLTGHGRSEGKRGHVERFDDYVDDLGAFLKYLATNNKLQGPVVLFGHSMGGLILSKYLIEMDGTWSFSYLASILSSPAFGVSLPVPKIKDRAAQVLNDYWPSLTLSTGLPNGDLTSLPEYLRNYERDTLRHTRISAPVYFGMKKNFDFAIDNAGRINGPLLIQAAGKERVTSLPATKKFFEHLETPTKKLLIYDDSLHEIYNDRQRDQVIRDADQFVRALLN